MMSLDHTMNLLGLRDTWVSRSDLNIGGSRDNLAWVEILKYAVKVSLTSRRCGCHRLREHDRLAVEGILGKNTHQVRCGEPYSTFGTPQASDHLSRPDSTRANRASQGRTNEQSHVATANHPRARMDDGIPQNKRCAAQRLQRARVKHNQRCRIADGCSRHAGEKYDKPKRRDKGLQAATALDRRWGRLCQTH